jgi:glutathione-regulated potassium-efflux system ancillary protein KefG
VLYDEANPTEAAFMPKILILFAHPRFEHSRSHAALLRHLPTDPDITFHDLYEHYPDFNIATAHEQQLLLEHDVILWQHPLYWYSCPPLLKQWIDLVLLHGWAYGPGGTALNGKTVAQVLTTGGTRSAYTPEGHHQFTLAEFLRPFQRTTTLCHMQYLPPFVVHDSHHLTPDALEAYGQAYARLLIGLKHQLPEASKLASLTYLNDWSPH